MNTFKKLICLLITITSSLSFAGYHLNLNCSNGSADINISVNSQGQELSITYMNEKTVRYVSDEADTAKSYLFQNQTDFQSEDQKKIDFLSLQLSNGLSTSSHGAKTNSAMMQIKAWPPFSKDAAPTSGEISLALNGSIYQFTNCKKASLEADANL